MIRWAGRDGTDPWGSGVTLKWLTHSFGTEIMCEQNNLWLRRLELRRMPEMSNDLLEVRLLWSQTIAQVVTAVGATASMVLQESEANGLNHWRGSLINKKDPAMSYIWKWEMSPLINTGPICVTKTGNVSVPGLFSAALCLSPLLLFLLPSPVMLFVVSANSRTPLSYSASDVVM